MPQIASGENVLSRSATAPISLPSMYTGLPLIPPATLVRCALPPILPRITSCLGPQAFFHRPIISTGTASGSEPLNTVQAVAIMPGLSSEDFMIWTGPALGGLGEVLPASARTAVAAIARNAAAIRLVIFSSVTPYFNCTTLGILFHSGVRNV